MKKIYTSIDIGSDTIKIVVGELFKEQINILAATSIKSKGIRKGLIVDANLALNAVKDGIKEIEELLNIKIDKVIVNVPVYNAKFLYVTGHCKIENDEKQVTSNDIIKILKETVVKKNEADRELVTIIPLEFTVDDEKGIASPLGKKGSKLGMKGIMVTTPKKNIYSVVSVIEGAGLEVVDITLGSIGDYYEVKTDQTDLKIGAIINIGSDTTTVSVFNKGKLMNSEILQIGGKHIDQDLSYVFGIDLFEGKSLKEGFAVAHKRYSQLNELTEIKNTSREVIKINQFEVSEVVMSRILEILDLAKKQILLLTKQEISYIIITGGITEMKAFRQAALEVFDKNISIYNLKTLGVRDNKYVTALGMIKYFCDKMNLRGKNYTMISEAAESELVVPKSRVKETNKVETIINKLFGNFLGK